MLEEAFFPRSPLFLDRLPFNSICSSFFLTLSFEQDASQSLVAVLLPAGLWSEIVFIF
jgi:hypothetical protein